jgi:hypothetical protein
MFRFITSLNKQSKEFKSEAKQLRETAPQEVKTILANVNTGLTCTQRSLYSVKKHINTLQSSEPQDVTSINDSITYMRWFLRGSSRHISFILALQNWGAQKNAANKCMSGMVLAPVRTAMNTMLFSSERARLSGVCKAFGIFAAQNRKLYGPSLNFRGTLRQVITLRPFISGPSHFDQSKNTFVSLNDSDRMRQLRDGRFFRICKKNQVVTYQKTEDGRVDFSSETTLSFPFDKKEESPISSIDILLDGRYIVGKENGNIEYYDHELKLEKVLKDDRYNFIKELRALSTGSVIGIHFKRDNPLTSPSPVMVAVNVNPVTGKMSEIDLSPVFNRWGFCSTLFELNIGNIVELPYQHFAMALSQFPEYIAELAVFRCQDLHLVNQIRMPQEFGFPEEVPMLAVQGARIIASLPNEDFRIFEFPTCIQDDKKTEEQVANSKQGDVGLHEKHSAQPTVLSRSLN